MGMLRWRRSVLAVVCVLSLGCSGCSKDDSKPTDPKTLSTSSSVFPPPSSPSLTADQQAIISQYKAYFTAITTLVGVSHVAAMNELTSYAYPEIAKIGADNLQFVSGHGYKYGGEITFSTNLAPVIQTDKATLDECRDESGETVVEVSTGKIIATGSKGTEISANFNHDSDGKWRIAKIVSERDQC